MTLLQQYLAEFSSRSFVRGVSDCCGLVAGWLELCSGRILACPLIGRPLSDAEAAEILGRQSLLERARDVLSAHGWEIRESEPQDGDVIILMSGEALSRTSLGIWSAGQLVTTSRHGMRLIRAAKITEMEAWHGR